ncbi:MAG: arsenate reductase ArsC [Elusimicrobia bacterium HGW-Elusimicrobia-1]|jgi:arsenate reductase|nr:MAG: arsenate reductase ArsC [Elusimicrobia bacterium HGW-Elusimicrobia-1]
MGKKKVLFICVHNSARSQMAETFLNALGGEIFEAKSAGLEPGKLNPVVVEAMMEIGLDISGNKAKKAADIAVSGESFDFVITVCDNGAAATCPFFPGGGERLHWGFDDPSSFTGTYDEKLAKTRVVRDQIKNKMADFSSGKTGGKENV